MSKVARKTVLHYTGADEDRGGIHAVVRALATADRFECVLGVNTGFVQHRTPMLPTIEFPAIAGETLGLSTFWRAWQVARTVSGWLAEDPERVFHGHSRAGLAVALWLTRGGERRVVVSVHCYGRRRWFYRWAARRLGQRLFWLSPAMRNYYSVAGVEWEQCIPGCVPTSMVGATEVARGRDGVVRLGGIGMLVAWKRWDLILEALDGLPENVRAKLHFRHIGGTDGSAESRRYAEKLRAMTAARGLGGLVEWRGEQPGAAEFLRETDCLVVASHHEPFSVAMIEALGMGVPVVAADSGGARDVIGPARNGWLFRTDDAYDLARTLADIATPGVLDRVTVDRDFLRQLTAPIVAGQWVQAYARLSAGD